MSGPPNLLAVGSELVEEGQRRVHYCAGNVRGGGVYLYCKAYEVRMIDGWHRWCEIPVSDKWIKQEILKVGARVAKRMRAIGKCTFQTIGLPGRVKGVHANTAHNQARIAAKEAEKIYKD